MGTEQLSIEYIGISFNTTKAFEFLRWDFWIHYTSPIDGFTFWFLRREQRVHFAKKAYIIMKNFGMGGGWRPLSMLTNQIA